MPRQPRKRSSTGIYHVVWRGTARQNIFKDKNDYKKFLGAVSSCKDNFSAKIYGYCLMSNHIHLLVQTDNISGFMKKLGEKYAMWFNKKYQRSGHLFEGRFSSEAVEDDKYFMTVLRYIHQNPVKANITEKAEQYEWSSYNSYFDDTPLVDRGFALELMGEENFVEYNNMPNADKCLDR